MPNAVTSHPPPEGTRPPDGDVSEFAPVSPSGAPAIERSPSIPAATTLLAETELIRAGLAALHAADPSRALALFDQHALAFPEGILADERDVERITALCALGRSAEARAAGASFLRRRPEAPLAGRVLSSCGNPSPPIP